MRHLLKHLSVRSLLWGVLMAVLWTGSALTADAQARTQGGDSPIPAEAERLFVRGMTHAFLDDYERAIAFYERALERAPRQAAILSALADAQAEQGEFDTAIFYAEQAYQTASQNTHYSLQLAGLYKETGATEDAIDQYRALIEAKPRTTEAYQSLADLLSNNNQPRAALGVYRDLIDRTGASPRTYLNMLRLHRRLNDTEGIRSTLQALVELQPNEPYFRRELADFYADQGATEQAIRAYERVLESSPDDAQTALALAKLYRATDQPEKASQLLDRVLDTENASAEQLVQRARPFYQRAQRDSNAAKSAVPLLERALELDSDNEAALRMLGTLRFRNGAYAEAGDLLTRALDQNPRAPERWAQAAAAYLQAGQSARAAEVADEGLLLFPGQLPLVRVSAYALMESNQNAEAIERFETVLGLIEDETGVSDQRARFSAALGLLYSRTKDYEASDRYYEQALAADSTLTLALNNYAYSLAERGTRLDRALELARRAVDLDPNQASFLDTLGWVYFQRDALEQARKWIRQAIDTGDASATVYEHLGDIYEAQGDTSQARKYWREALDRAPDRPSLQEKLDASASSSN